VSPVLFIYLSVVAQCNAEKFGKKLFGDNDIEDILQRLDRLTHDEARTTAAQTLGVVYGLLKKMNTYFDGGQSRFGCHSLIELRSLDGNLKASTNNIQEALGTFG
jgi:hypothetical protein